MEKYLDLNGAQRLVRNVKELIKSSEAETNKKVEQNATDIAELKEGVEDYYVGENDEVTGDPHFKNCKGNKEFLGEWHPFLIDHTDNTGEATHPVGQLMDNNHFRFVSGAFAPTVGITKAMRAACDVQLYTDAEHTIPLTLKMVLSLLIRLAHILTMQQRCITRLAWWTCTTARVTRCVSCCLGKPQRPSIR